MTAISTQPVDNITARLMIIRFDRLCLACFDLIKEKKSCVPVLSRSSRNPRVKTVPIKVALLYFVANSGKIHFSSNLPHVPAVALLQPIKVEFRYVCRPRECYQAIPLVDTATEKSALQQADPPGVAM